MESNKWTKKNIAIVSIAGVVLVFLLFGGYSGYSEIKRLKKELKTNEKSIQKIEKSKEPLFESIKNDSLKLIEKNKQILDLSNRERVLRGTIKHYQDENNRLKSSYRSGNVHERIRIFTRLATEADTIR